MEPGMLSKVSNLVEDECLAFFQFVYANYKKAEHKAGAHQDRYFLIGGRCVQLRFVGNGLVSALTPALAHLETSPTETPELTILAWDSASSNTALPSILEHYFDSLGEWWNHLGRRGEIRELTNDRVRFAYHLGPNIFSGLDLQENLGLYWVQDAERLPYYEVGSPLRTILHWWARPRKLSVRSWRRSWFGEWRGFAGRKGRLWKIHHCLHLIFRSWLAVCRR